jgi:hypothetical protein
LDRRRPSAALAALLAALSLAAGRDAAPLAELRWLDPAAAPVAALTTRPDECLPAPPPGAPALEIEVGRAAFRSPLLLGGQAARAGLSCESCHQEGRDNPTFHFPGLSGSPGTADITTSLLSSHRGDGVANPRPIPDLSAPKADLRIRQDPGGRALETFIQGLVVEEFDGQPPSPGVLAGLAAYVRALEPCPRRLRPLRVTDYLSDARRAARAGAGLLGSGDSASALVMIAAARARLGQIDERYAGLPEARAALAGADRDLAAIAAGIRSGDPGAAGRLTDADRILRALSAPLEQDEERSLFDRARLGLLLQGP